MNKIPDGFYICVLSNGFVYVGDFTLHVTWFTITNARNVRTWGTTRGLGQLAISGPTKDTKLDPVGSVKAPIASLQHLIETEQSCWNDKKQS